MCNALPLFIYLQENDYCYLTLFNHSRDTYPMKYLKSESSEKSLTEMSDLKLIIVHQLCYYVKGDGKIHYRQKSANRSKDLQCL